MSNHVSRIFGLVSLRPRAQALADLQGRRWFVVSPGKGEPYATADLSDVIPGATLTLVRPARGNA
jgi:hypothetical protein